MGVMDLIAARTEEEQCLIASLLANDGLLLEIDCTLYGAMWFDKGWWVYKLKVSAPEYFVDRHLKHCSCPAFDGIVCKHITMLANAVRQTPNWKGRKKPPRPADWRKRGQ